MMIAMKARDSIRSAVSIFNNPTIQNRAQIFIVNSIISWTYLMHSYFDKHNIEYFYKKEGVPLKNKNGTLRYWDLSECLKNCSETSGPTRKNLEYIIGARHIIEHQPGEDIQPHLEPKFQACCINFDRYITNWFGEAFSVGADLKFAIQLSELRISNKHSKEKIVSLPQSIIELNSQVESDMITADLESPEYSYRVYIVPRVTRNPNNADQAVIFAPEGSEIELAVRDVEKPKFRPTDVVNIMKAEGYTDFEIHGKGGFVEIWKQIDGKNPKNGYGVEISGTWYRYQTMVEKVRLILSERKFSSENSAF